MILNFCGGVKLVVDDVDLGRTGNLLERHRSNVPMKDVHLLYPLIEEARAEPNVRRHNGRGTFREL
jgi:hypothetical protein